MIVLSEAESTKMWTGTLLYRRIWQRKLTPRTKANVIHAKLMLMCKTLTRKYMMIRDFFSSTPLLGPLSIPPTLPRDHRSAPMYQRSSDSHYK